MNRSVRSLLAAALLLASGCRSAPVAAPPATNARPTTLTTLALCEDYPEESRTLAGVERDLTLLQSLGITRLRVALGWDGIEPKPGQYDWSFWDKFFDLADKHGGTLLPYLCYTPEWAARARETPWKQPPRQVADFARFAGAAAARYRGHVQSWELWNEPDNKDYWLGSVADFAALTKAGAEAVRQADPQAKIVLGGISWNTDYVCQLFADHAIAESVDIVNVHSYAETWFPEPMETIPAMIGRVDETIRRYGHGERIWMAEAGYSDFRRGTFVSSIYSARYDYEHTPSFQADALIRMLALAMSANKVDLFAWYRIHDLPQAHDVIGDVNNRHLGILDVNGHRKPAAVALRRAAEMLGNVTRCIDDELGLGQASPADVHAHAFRRADGDVIIVAWLNSPPAASPATARPVADDRQRILRVTLPGDWRVRHAATATRLAQLFEPARSNNASTITIKIFSPETVLLDLTPRRQRPIRP